MNKLTYLKKRERWDADAKVWPYYIRVVGCSIDCDADGSGYLLLSDGSKSSVDDLDAARILLFSRKIAGKYDTQNNVSAFEKIRVKLACLVAGV